MIYVKLVKPFFDYLLALFLLILSAPLIIALYFVLLIHLKGNPVFVQSRPGYKAKIFKIYKFKTMLDTRDTENNLLPDEERLTKLGLLIRKFSLDELLQFINILKGEMSFVGPRPLLVHYLDLYDSTQAQRHNVKPGITGWAQVNGRNAISWTDKFNLDVWYVNNLSLLVDLKIFYLTIIKVLRQSDINLEGSATTKNFEGN